jgi:hypothetical protein
LPIDVPILCESLPTRAASQAAFCRLATLLPDGEAADAPGERRQAEQTPHEEVAFQAAFSRRELRAALQGAFGSAPGKAAAAMRKRMVKHLCKEENLLPDAWARCGARVDGRRDWRG